MVMDSGKRDTSCNPNYMDYIDLARYIQISQIRPHLGLNPNFETTFQALINLARSQVDSMSMFRPLLTRKSPLPRNFTFSRIISSFSHTPHYTALTSLPN